ncbi:hypothetical protein D3C86_2157590 [compost metagenome]
MLGTARNPADEAVYLDKFRSNVEGVITATQAAHLVDRFLHIDQVADVEALLAPLRW